MNKLVVLFPGIGYTNDKPLLYYSSYIATRRGYEVIKLDFSGFPKGAKGDEKKILECFDIAVRQAEDALKDVDFDKYVDIIFISKSIGTGAAAYYASKHKVKARHIFFTPLEKTISLAKNGSSAIAFTGTADPWADYDTVRDICSKKKIPLTIIENANHSLETGVLNVDIGILSEVMNIVSDYIGL